MLKYHCLEKLLEAYLAFSLGQADLVLRIAAGDVRK